MDTPINSLVSLSHIVSIISSRLLTKYNACQGYVSSCNIDDLIVKKQSYGNRLAIHTKDVMYNDEKEYLEKVYCDRQINDELPELLEYYKYYSQEAVCFLNEEFAFLVSNLERKKAKLYQNLKKKLNLSHNQSSFSAVTKTKQPKKYPQFLEGLSGLSNNDESYLLQQMLKKLNGHFGTTKPLQLNKIDKQFNFMAHSHVFGKSKAITKEVVKSKNSKNMLESTNTSVKNGSIVKRQRTQNNVQRRFMSCDIPKSCLLKSGTISKKGKQTQKVKKFSKDKAKEKVRKAKKIQRRKSAQFISDYEYTASLTSMESHKKNLIETQQLSSHKGSTMCLTENNFREKMEELRIRIRKQKEKLGKSDKITQQGKRKIKKC